MPYFSTASRAKACPPLASRIKQAMFSRLVDTAGVNIALVYLMRLSGCFKEGDGRRD
jgi:hypothetical protein